jgi:hypothetical protein
MMASDSRLRDRFVQAIDEVVRPAPWLEAEVVEALRRHPSSGRRALRLGSFGGFRSGFRLAAGLVALLIAVATVAALLMSSHLHTTTVPGGRKAPSLPPAGLMSAAIAYDAGNKTVVVFGGYSPDTAAPKGETWTWDGIAWTGHKPVTSPSPRDFAAMAYDETRGVTVMFGGNTVGASGPVDISDTWIWDGRTWRQLHPAQSPPAMNGPVMAYDPALRVIVLFGNGETWTWDGSTWNQLHPQMSPPAAMDGYQKALAYHAATQTLLLFGNQQPLGGTVTSETWTFDGSTWTRHAESSGTAPTGILPSMAADDATGTVVLVDEQGTTWIWDGQSWSQRHPSTSPPPRQQEAMAYDSDRHVVVLFGGYHKPFVADTWTWDGSTWTQRT